MPISFTPPEGAHRDHLESLDERMTDGASSLSDIRERLAHPEGETPTDPIKGERMTAREFLFSNRAGSLSGKLKWHTRVPGEVARVGWAAELTFIHVVLPQLVKAGKEQAEKNRKERLLADGDVRQFLKDMSEGPSNWEQQPGIREGVVAAAVAAAPIPAGAPF